MMQKYALTIGVKYVDKTAYGGWDEVLQKPEKDAKDMANILKAHGYETETILTESATFNAVKSHILSYAEKLTDGDYLLIYYSGHGGRDDRNDNPNNERNDELEKVDGIDDCWCLYDRPLWDDNLVNMLSLFKKVKIVVISDSCNSGTMIDVNTPIGNRVKILNSKAYEKISFKEIPIQYLSGFINIFDGGHNENPNEKIRPEVLLMASCLEHQSCIEWVHNSLFTEFLIAALKEFNYNVTFDELLSTINNMVSNRVSDQTANITERWVSKGGLRDTKLLPL